MAVSRLERTRELLGEKTPPAAWHWAMALAQAASDGFDAALETARAGVTAYPDHAVLRNNLAVLLELRGDTAGAEQMLKQAFAADPGAAAGVEEHRRPAVSRRPVRRGATRPTSAPSRVAPELGDDLYFKLGNIAFKRRDTRAGPRELGACDGTQPGPPAGAGQPRHARGRGVTVHEDAGFDALRQGPDGAHRRVAGGLQGRSAFAGASPCACAPAACTPTTSIAACWRAPRRKWSKLHDALTINVTRFFRNPETWEAVKANVLPGLLAKARAGAGVERRLLLR